MPTFNFRCTKCSNEFSEKITFGSKKYPSCPKCEGKSEKLLTPPMGIMFKGSGFYKTDSQRPQAKPAEKKAEDKKEAAKPAETKMIDAKPQQSSKQPPTPAP